MRGKNIVWPVLGALATTGLLLAALMLAANFHLARSETRSDVTTASARWPSGAAMPPQTIHYRVEGGAPLAEALAEALARELPDAQPVEGTDVPDLIVRLDEVAISWTPVGGRADLLVTAAFSSNGDFSFRETDPYFFALEDGDEGDMGRIVQAATAISVVDESVGLLSRPGYLDRLAAAVAAEVDKALQTQVFAAP